MFSHQQIKYYLDEDDAWSIKVEELQRALDESKSHCQPRLMAVINPGNPTGICNKDIRYTNNKFCYLTVITSTRVSIISNISNLTII